MAELINLWIDNREQNKEIEKLKNLLKLAGLECNVKVINYDMVKEYSMLQIEYESGRIIHARKRNAGRPIIDFDHKYKCKDIKDLLKRMSKDQLAEMLGISRATLYRKLKKNALNKDENYFC